VPRLIIRAAIGADIIILLSLAVSASAQSTIGRWGAFAGVEVAHSTEDEGFLGAGPGVYGGVSYRLARNTSLAMEIGTERHVRDFRFLTAVPGQIQPVPFDVRWAGSAVFLVANVQHGFGATRARPFVFGGGGLMHDAGTTRRIVDRSEVPASVTLPPHFDSPSATVSVIDGGGGVEIRIRDRLRLEPFAGIRLASSGETGPKYIVRYGLTVAF
jgi:hypothetical protein